MFLDAHGSITYSLGGCSLILPKHGYDNLGEYIIHVSIVFLFLANSFWILVLTPLSFAASTTSVRVISNTL